MARRSNSVDGVLGNVLIDQGGGAYSIVESQDPEHNPQRFAISTTELTCQEIYEFLRILEADTPVRLSQQPFEFRKFQDFKAVLQYCNWMTLQNQLGEKHRCFPVEFTIEEIKEHPPQIYKLGYRLPLHREWEVANQSNEFVETLMFESEPVVLDYANTIENTRAKVQFVAQRLPNAAGIFDSYGNLQELCQFDSDGGLYARGHTVRAEASALKSKELMPQPINTSGQQRNGFRLIRSLE
jgi:hypothetical protein